MASDIITTGVFVPLVMGFFWKRGNSKGAVASMAVGIVYCLYNLIIGFGVKLPSFWEPQSALQVIFGVGLSLVVYVFVSLITPSEKEKAEVFIKKSKGENIPEKQKSSQRGYKGGTAVTRKKIAVGATIIFILIFTIFSLVFSVDTNQSELLENASDIESFDFSKNIGYIGVEAFEAYPQKMYTPEDFKGESAEMLSSVSVKGSRATKICTYRILIPLPVGKVFSIYENSTSNFQKIWVDGELMIQSGSANAIKDGSLAQEPRCNFASFTVKNELTEIIVQRNDITRMTKESFSGLYVGTSSMLSGLTNLMFFSNTLPIGAVLAIMLIFFATYIFFTRYRRFLWFSCTCGALTASELFSPPQIFAMLYPDTGWQFRMRFDSIAGFLFLFFILLYLDKMYENAMGKITKLIVYILAGVSAVLCALLPFDVYLKLLALSPYILSLCGVIIIFSILIGVAKWYFSEKYMLKSEQMLILIGGVVFGFLAFLDSIVYINYGDTNILEAGALIFVSANAIALTVNFMRTENELKESRKRELEVIREKNNLTELSKMKADFMANVGHELKTPLTVMGSYAGLTIKQIEKNAVTSETVKNLDVIQQEAVRLGLLVEQLSASACDRHNEIIIGTVNVRELFIRTEKFCTPVCSKNHNIILVNFPEENLFVKGNDDALFQVLYNLITNSNRHTQDGKIILSAERLYKSVRISITDSGEGIASEKLPYVFERGYSGDNSSGIGLSLCREIIESFGGSIRIDNVLSGGAVVTILLPVEGGDNNEQKSHITY